jgi:hypothetical protein
MTIPLLPADIIDSPGGLFTLPLAVRYAYECTLEIAPQHNSKVKKRFAIPCSNVFLDLLFN